MNPMFRVAAAWQRTPVEELTLEQFESVKHYAVIALATSDRPGHCSGGDHRVAA